MQAAKLDPAVNNWRNVYDFNAARGDDAAAEEQHWSLATPPEEVKTPFHFWLWRH